MKARELFEYIDQITRLRRIDREYVIKSLKDSFEIAIKKYFRDNAFPIEVEINEKTGEIKIWILKKVVNEIKNPNYEITYQEAKKIKPLVVPGENIRVEMSIEELGRGVIYRMKEMFTKKIKDAERERIYKDFETKIGDIVRGVVQKVDKSGVYLGLGRADGFMPPEEQIRKEKYRIGSEVRGLVLSVETSGRRPLVKISRTHPNFLRKLLELEVPEILDGVVEIMGIVRIPGERAKVAVRSHDPRVDPQGACIGIRGSRIQIITRELAGEKIDVIPWSENKLEFAKNALSPSRPLHVVKEEDKIIAVVPDEEIKAAKGTGSQNAQLASKLVGDEIWVISQSEWEGRKKVLIDEMIMPDEIKIELKKETDGVFSIYELRGRLKTMKIY
ncbi:MAG: transcription termination factor NusA [Candidatus Hydrothermales bacterium]